MSIHPAHGNKPPFPIPHSIVYKGMEFYAVPIDSLDNPGTMDAYVSPLVEKVSNTNDRETRLIDVLTNWRQFVAIIGYQKLEEGKRTGKLEDAGLDQHLWQPVGLYYDIFSQFVPKKQRMDEFLVYGNPGLPKLPKPPLHPKVAEVLTYLVYDQKYLALAFFTED